MAEKPKSAEPVTSLAVDLSNWQGRISPETVAAWKANGVKLVIVRLSTEDTEKIAIAKQQLDVCRDGGLKLGGYCWLYLDGADSGAVQVENALVHYGFYDLSVFALDVEDKSTLTVAENIEIISQAVDIARGHGLPVYIYTSPEAWERLTGGMALFGNVKLWTVLWGKGPADFVPYGAWRDWAIMQTSGGTDMAGVNVDINILKRG